MLGTTLKLVKAAFQADPTLTALDRRRLVVQLTQPAKAPAALSASASAEPRLIRRAEAARRLGCSVRLIDRLSAEGVLPKRRLPRRVRASGILLSDLEALMATGAHVQPSSRSEEPNT